jgi:hypothetical protein
MTPFLSLVHMAVRRRLVCRAWAKLDALATMIQREAETYDQWLSKPKVILDVLATHFVTVRARVGCGKLSFLGRKRSTGQMPSLSSAERSTLDSLDGSAEW